MENHPTLSIVIPLYNKEKDIGATLKSLSAQSFRDFEIVVIDDGSTDGSLDIVKNFDDSRLRIFSKLNEGVAPTRNFGVENALSDFVVFLDADDYWYPFHLENMYQLIQKFPEGKWYATAYEKQFNKRLVQPIQSPIMKSGDTWQGWVENFFENSLVDCLAWTSAVCFRKSFFLELNGFDCAITMGAGEDTDLWMRAALAHPLVFSNKISARHNLHGSNRISNTPTLTRKFLNLDRYEEAAKNDPFLKKYIDLNRYSIAVQHKLAGDPLTFKAHARKLDRASLSWKQQLIIELPKVVIQMLWSTKNKLERLGIRTTSF